MLYTAKYGPLVNLRQLTRRLHSNSREVPIVTLGRRLRSNRAYGPRVVVSPTLSDGFYLTGVADVLSLQASLESC